jgi:hypothetical protein
MPTAMIAAALVGIFIYASSAYSVRMQASNKED